MLKGPLALWGGGGGEIKAGGGGEGYLRVLFTEGDVSCHHFYHQLTRYDLMTVVTKLLSHRACIYLGINECSFLQIFHISSEFFLYLSFPLFIYCL